MSYVDAEPGSARNHLPALSPIAAALSPAGRQPRERVRIQLYAALMLADALAVLLGFAAFNLMRFGTDFSAEAMAPALLILPIFIATAINYDAYTLDVLLARKQGAMRAATALMFAITAVLFLAFFLKVSADFSRLAFAVGGAAGMTLLITERLIYGAAVARLDRAAVVTEIMIVDGVAPPARGDALLIDAERLGLAPDIRDPVMLDRLGHLMKNADRVVIACPPERRRDWAMTLKGANVHGEIIAPEIEELGAVASARFSSHATLVVSAGPLGLRNRLQKRALDLVVALAAGIALAPLMLLVALAIRLEGPGPIFFVQRRLGRGNCFFAMYKFRSMRPEQCDRDGTRSTGRDDDRITRVGRFIRATSIDELPQILNVIKGDMSLVGPRPHALGSLAGDKLFWEVDQRYWHRHACKPGLTGLAQVRGHRGATHRVSDLVNRLQADLEYLDGWTIWRDITILFRTLSVLVHRNAY